MDTSQILKILWAEIMTIYFSVKRKLDCEFKCENLVVNQSKCGLDLTQRLKKTLSAHIYVKVNVAFWKDSLHFSQLTILAICSYSPV